jgi:flagellar hook-basal body complex protein FliE
MSDAITLARPQTTIGDGAATISQSPNMGLGTQDHQADGLPFAGVLQQALADANHTQNVASHKAEEFAAGRNDDIHGTMIASKQAEIELHLVATVKNKVVDAINDLLRMSI